MLAHKFQAIVLAAGKSTRFCTDQTKLAEKICGQEMILYPTTLLAQLNIPTTLVVGYQKDKIQDIITKRHGNTVQFMVQKEQQGTGHALACTKDIWNKEHILIMNGDVPLINSTIIEELFNTHLSQNADVSFVMSCYTDPNHGYGRIIKKENKIEIVEAKEFQGDKSEHCCINAGIYVVRKSFLQETVDTIKKSNVSNEFYITDLIKIASDLEKPVATISAPFDYIRGINTFQELWAAQQIKRSELIKYWMERGVHFAVAQNVHIDLDVQIGSGTYIGCGVHLLNGTKIGKKCKINEFTSIENTTIKDGTIIYSHSVISNSNIGANVKVGPFAHIRAGSTLENDSIIGNFVELKNTRIGQKTKAKHLTFLGDAEIGNKVNIGAGTITCNYDGATKHKTIIKDETFIGSNNTIVAPVTIEEHAFTAAGSVITEDVPKESLAVGRARQLNKHGYAKKLKKRIQKNNEEEQHDETTSEDYSFNAAIKTKQNTSEQL